MGNKDIHDKKGRKVGELRDPPSGKSAGLLLAAILVGFLAIVLGAGTKSEFVFLFLILLAMALFAAGMNAALYGD